jgi:hypothetical protein
MRADGRHRQIPRSASVTDKRRYGVIEVRRRNAETYHLVIDGQMWSEVEWSHDRQAWCVQDAAGHCLAHIEHIVGENRDVETGIRLAKRIIVDGRMPTPEEALASLESSGGARKASADDVRELIEALTIKTAGRGHV